VRMVLLVAGLLLAAIDIRWLIGALGVIAVLAAITTIQRILFTHNQSRSQTQEVNH
jgi:hypothetical protein